MNGSREQEVALRLPMNGDASDEVLRQDPGDCTEISGLLTHVGDKWTVLVVYTLGNGPLRFNMLKRQVEGISQRMLTLTLRGLERDGLISRTVFPTVPPAVEYALTPLGQSFLAPVEALGKWALTNYASITSARRAFDARSSD